jgi:hypothetical protein
VKKPKGRALPPNSRVGMRRTQESVGLEVFVGAAGRARGVVSDSFLHPRTVRRINHEAIK